MQNEINSALVEYCVYDMGRVTLVLITETRHQEKQTPPPPTSIAGATETFVIYLREFLD